MSKFTFKQRNDKKSIVIILNDKMVGMIAEGHQLDDVSNNEIWTIRFLVKSDKFFEDGWAWTQLKSKFINALSAQVFVEKNAETFLSRFDLHPIDL